MTFQKLDSGEVIYRGMNSVSLDAAYNNTEAVSDSHIFMDRWRKRSTILRRADNASLDIAYGPRAATRLDYFSAPGANAPLFVFFHGGYWQNNSKEIFAFSSAGPIARGINVAVIGYTLAPEAKLTQIVEESRQALDFLSDRANKFTLGHEKIFVGGWSAGGHLAALASDHPAVHGGLSISGIFDLEPIALSYLNEKLRLDEHEITALSPLHNLSDKISPIHLYVGAVELDELRRQSEIYEAEANNLNLPVSLSILPEHNHYSILDELADSGGILTLKLVQLTEMSK